MLGPKLKFEPPVIAHRGARSFAPENTLPAFIKAKELGFNWVEFDVRLAACGEAIIFHDETLDRTTDGTGRIQDYPYSYLKTLDAGSWFDPSFSGEKIPDLKETLALLQAQGIAANIEIKSVLGAEEKIAQRVLDVLQASGLRVPCFISSFSPVILHYIRKQSPDVLMGFLMDKWQPDWQRTCDQLDAFAVNVDDAILNKENINEIKASNRLVLSYTVNNPERAIELLNIGVDAIFSDCPDEFIVGIAARLETIYGNK